MAHGVETLSFDLFGLARRFSPLREKASNASAKKPAPVASHSDDVDDEDARRHEIFFWGMFPIL